MKNLNNLQQNILSSALKLIIEQASRLALITYTNKEFGVLDPKYIEGYAKNNNYLLESFAHSMFNAFISLKKLSGTSELLPFTRYRYQKEIECLAERDLLVPYKSYERKMLKFNAEPFKNMLDDAVNFYMEKHGFTYESKRDGLGATIRMITKPSEFSTTELYKQCQDYLSEKWTLNKFFG